MGGMLGMDGKRGETNEERQGGKRQGKGRGIKH